MDRGVYSQIDFRAALHPSETTTYLVTRVLAYALNFQDGLEFSPGGLSDPDAPALQKASDRGGISLWIEIGNPSARKLHKASKASDEVRVYTYKDPKILLEEIHSEKIHKSEQLGIYSFDPKFLEQLVAGLDKNNSWTLMSSEGNLTVGLGETVIHSEMRKHSV